ncbi:MAG: acyl-CoA dehydrogenase [bacterium]|nr:acyl-CoA dehydrogenase [Deltaproteobacteria bacterium]MCP4907420.1 acyl-CoA dehydrogenase [bacterium]
MDLSYTASDEVFRSQLRSWLGAEVPKHGAAPPPGEWKEVRAYDTAWQRKLFDAGFAGLGWPRAYGGAEAALSEQLIYFEEIARAGAPYIGANFIGVMHGGPTLIAEGSEEQKAFHLPAILKGEEVWCQGFSEPEAGSDLASLRTSARREGDEYVINGHKIWSTRAHIADYCELLVRTGPDPHSASSPSPSPKLKKHAGITWLILPMDQPGVDVRPIETLEGESHFCEVFLDDARVPVANRVGEENDGWRVANVTLRFERGTSFAPHIIALRDQIRRLVALMRKDRFSWEDPLLRQRIGRLEGDVEGLWRLTQMCVSEAAKTGVPSLLGSAVKLGYSELYQEIGELGIELLGRDALSGEDLPGRPVAEMLHDYLWSIQFTISGGTSQVQRNIIAERILGLPKEPRG